MRKLQAYLNILQYTLYRQSEDTLGQFKNYFGREEPFVWILSRHMDHLEHFCFILTSFVLM